MPKKWTPDEERRLLENKDKPLKELARMFGVSSDAVRKKLKRLAERAELGLDSPNPETASAIKEIPDQNPLRKFLSQPRSLIEVANYLDCSPKTAEKAVQRLADDGVQIEKLDDERIYIPKTPVVRREVFETETEPDEGWYRIAVMSDTHVGSKSCRWDAIREFVRYCVEERGILDFYHAGDVLEGIRVYQGQEVELRVWGLEEQVAELVENFPYYDGMSVRFITGNHDLAYLKLSGKDPGTEMAQKMKGWEYLGQMNAQVKIGGTVIELFHGDGGGAYALSYHPQRIISELEGGRKPNIMIFGHWHSSLYIPNLRNIQALCAGCFQDQTLYLKRKHIQPHIGGWIIEFQADENGGIMGFKAEWRAFY